MMPDNDWYGHKSILAKYCDVNIQPIFGSIQHGWFATKPELLFNDKSKIFKYFCWSSHYKKKAQNAGFKNFHPIGAPFLYLCKLKRFSFDKFINQGEGTILFPSKTTHCEKRFNNEEELIKLAIKDYPPPYSVSLFHSDTTNNLLKLYKKYGFEILNFGKRSNINFLDECYDTLIKKRCVLSNEPGTAILYGMYLGKRCHINIKNFDIKNLDLSNFSRIKCFLTSKEYLSKFQLVFDGKLNLQEQYNLAKSELGHEDMLNQNDLKKILGWSSIIKKLSSRLIYEYLNIKHGIKQRSGEI